MAIDDWLCDYCKLTEYILSTVSLHFSVAGGVPLIMSIEGFENLGKGRMLWSKTVIWVPVSAGQNR